MIRSNVVLPQPEGPTKHTISPAVIVRSIDCSATKLPKALCTASMRSASVAGTESAIFNVLTKTRASVPRAPRHRRPGGKRAGPCRAGATRGHRYLGAAFDS